METVEHKDSEGTVVGQYAVMIPHEIEVGADRQGMIEVTFKDQPTHPKAGKVTIYLFPRQMDDLILALEWARKRAAEPEQDDDEPEPAYPIGDARFGSW